jgi:cytosine/adenosine deaminase-related metal-dependent hydrolase
MIILKNANVLTLNALDEFGRYSLFINEGKIADMVKHEDSNEQIMNKYQKWTEIAGGKPEITDCSQKIIMPALINSCLKSESSFIKYLLRKRRYEDIQTDLCTDFIFNYIYQEMPSNEIKEDLDILYKFSFTKNLKFGVSSLNEITARKDTNHLEAISSAAAGTGQNVRICFPIKQDMKNLKESSYSYYLTDENQLTIYDLSTLSELKEENIRHLHLEVATNKDVTVKFKQTYNKPVIVLLDEYGLIDEKTSLINPLYLTYDEMKILSEKKANIIICPSDLIHFTNRYFPLDDFLNHNIKFSVATGWLGEDLFQEIRIFRDKYKELNIPNSDFLKSVTQIPKAIYFDDEATDSYYLDIGRKADMIFVDISDLRFQFLPENNRFEKICDFFVDNMTPFTISDVIIKGTFKIKNNRSIGIDESEILKQADQTRERLYTAGKYEEIQRRIEERKNIEELDLRSRDEEEIKLFSDAGAAALREEEKEDFKIKGKMPEFRLKISKGQKSLFEESEIKQLNEPEQYQDTPQLNLLYSELDENQNIEEEITQAKMAEQRMLKKTADKKTQPPEADAEKKVELPKNVKLKFGD